MVCLTGANRPSAWLGCLTVCSTEALAPAMTALPAALSPEQRRIVVADLRWLLTGAAEARHLPSVPAGHSPESLPSADRSARARGAQSSELASGGTSTACSRARRAGPARGPARWWRRARSGRPRPPGEPAASEPLRRTSDPLGGGPRSSTPVAEVERSLPTDFWCSRNSAVATAQTACNPMSSDPHDSCRRGRTRSLARCRTARGARPRTLRSVTIGTLSPRPERSIGMPEPPKTVS